MEMKNNPSKKGDIARSKSPQRSPVRVATATLSELGKKKETCFDNIVHVAKKVDPSLLSWTSLVVGGILLGVVEYCLTIFQVAINTWKHDILMKNMSSNALGVMYFVGLNCFLALIAACLVSKFSPICGGSGLPEMKALLNGTKVPNMLSKRTLLVKVIGIGLVVAAGFPVGQEGPMVHIGAIICSGVFSSRIFNPLDEDEVRVETAVDNGSFQSQKGLFATIGGAAGIAAAFNAPIGGILYVFEELSTFWTPDTTFRAFVCTAFAALSAQVCLYGGIGANHLESRVIFNVQDLRTIEGGVGGAGTNASQLGWTYLDFPFFILLSLICAIFSSIYTYGGVFMNRVRKNAKWRETNVAKISEVVAVCFFIGLLETCIPLVGAWNCKEMPVEAALDDELEMSSWGCANRQEYNPLSTLFFGGEEGVMKQMLGETTMFVDWDISVLLAFFVIYYTLSIFSLGLAIPLGTFIPQVVGGAVLGRVMGELVHMLDISPEKLSGPGTYSFIGAGAMLAGFTRMTVAVEVILIEASGAIGLSVPMMMSIIFARSVADRLLHAYDEQMLELKGYEFVHDEPHVEVERLIALDICTECPALGVVVGMAEARQAISNCSDELDAIPVGDGREGVLGLVSKRTLMDKIRINRRISVRINRRRSGIPSPQRTLQERIGSSLFSTDSRRGSFGEIGEVASDIIKGMAIDLTPMIDRDPYTVPSRTPIRRVYKLFRRMDLKHLVVTGYDNQCVGVISRHNLLRHRTRQEIEKLARSHNGRNMESGITEGDEGEESDDDDEDGGELVEFFGRSPPELQI